MRMIRRRKFMYFTKGDYRPRSSMVRVCVITVHPDGHDEYGPEFTVEVDNRFSDEMVAAMRQIPQSQRRYDPERKRWWFKTGYEEHLSGLAAKFFDEAHLVEGEVETNLITGSRSEQIAMFR
jgi:hypothetical protein